MPGRKNELINLIKKYRLGKASPQEVDFLEKYYQYFDKEEKISQQFSETEKIDLGKKIFSAIQSRKILAPVIPIHRRTWFRVAAASVLVFFAGSVYFILRHSNENIITKTEPQEIRFKNDVAAPMKAKATITLADGTTVALDSVNYGKLATQGNVNVMMTADGRIVYKEQSQGPGQMQYNTLSNPRGSKVIDMTLADGSRVWLNAGSSVTYPVAFVGNARTVSITGEAYFEVTHNAAMPFKVNKGEMEITDLGTSFNVNAYDDEADIKVTLIEGSVKISKGNATSLLKPGQQAKIMGDIKIVSGIDVDAVMAWKNGKFSFDKMDIESIMRQMARWYNVDVEFKDKIADKYTVNITRDVPVSQVFKFIEMTGGVHFEIDGNKVVVRK